jgi:gas vesicle protein
MEESKTKKSPFAFLSGIIVGGAVGAALSALFTPQSGKETRAQLKKKGEELVKKGKSELEKINKEKVQPMVKEMKEKVEDLKK